MEKLIDKLLSGEKILLSREETLELPLEEKEKLYSSIEAKVLEGKINKVIAVYLSHETGRTDTGKIEEYSSEEMYRVPYTEDKKMLREILELCKEKSHSYSMNRV